MTEQTPVKSIYYRLFGITVWEKTTYIQTSLIDELENLMRGCHD